MEAEVARPVPRLIAKPNGIILVTGLSGAGKTTTLYSALNELNVVTYGAELEQYVGVMPGEMAGCFSQEHPLSHPTRVTLPSAPRRVPSLP